MKLGSMIKRVAAMLLFMTAAAAAIGGITSPAGANAAGGIALSVIIAGMILAGVLLYKSSNKSIASPTELSSCKSETMHSPVQDHLRILKDSVELMQSTTNIETFWSRYDTGMQHARVLTQAKEANAKASRGYPEHLDFFVARVCSENAPRILDDSFCECKAGAERLKTVKGKIGRWTAYLDLLETYEKDFQRYGEEYERTKKRVHEEMEILTAVNAPERRSLPAEKPNPEVETHSGDFIASERTVTRADGQELTDEDAAYLFETGFERTQLLHQEQPRRSVEENIDIGQFAAENEEILRLLEDQLILPHLSSFDSVDEAIDHAQKALIAAWALEAFCSKSPSGKLYFEDKWLHCHNSKNPDFSFIDEIKKRYSDLTINYEVRKRDFELHQKRKAFLAVADDEVWNVINKNPGVLQKDVHRYFDADLKPTIGTAVGRLIKSGRISRVKHGNTFELTAIK